MRGLRRVSKVKPPRERPGLDDKDHLARIRKLPCLIAGKRATLKRWVGVYPNKQEVAEEYQHICTRSDSRDAHHVVRKSQRGSDRTTVALCRDAHRLLHHLGQPAFEQAFGVKLIVVASALGAKR